MKVTFTGEPLEIGAGTTLGQVFKEKGIGLDGTAAAVNDAIVPKAGFDTYELQEGMRLDVFTLVAGG